MQETSGRRSHAHCQAFLHMFNSCMCDMKNEKAVRSGAVFGYFNSHCETVRNSSDAAFLIPADGYQQPSREQPSVSAE